jgi:hypothetical protein
MELKTIKYLLRLEKRGANIPFDPTSSLYRICPQCSDDFMAETEQDVYCCYKCKDDFNNAKKLNRQINQKLDEDIETPSPKNISVELESAVKMNVELLEKIYDGNPKGMYITFEELDNLGFDFSGNNGQGTLYNTPNPDDCTFLVIGPFHIFRITFDIALLVKPQKL